MFVKASKNLLPIAKALAYCTSEVKKGMHVLLLFPVTECLAWRPYFKISIKMKEIMTTRSSGLFHKFNYKSKNCNLTWLQNKNKRKRFLEKRTVAIFQNTLKGSFTWTISACIFQLRFHWAATLSMTLGIETFSIMALGVNHLKCDTQHYDIQCRYAETQSIMHPIPL